MSYLRSLATQALRQPTRCTGQHRPRILAESIGRCSPHSVTGSWPGQPSRSRFARVVQGARAGLERLGSHDRTGSPIVDRRIGRRVLICYNILSVFGVHAPLSRTSLLARPMQRGLLFEEQAVLPQVSRPLVLAQWRRDVRAGGVWPSPSSAQPTGEITKSLLASSREIGVITST